jgi:hypothetical protein
VNLQVSMAVAADSQSSEGKRRKKRLKLDFRYVMVLME